MGKVNVSAENQVESQKRELLPANVVAEIVDAEYAIITKEAFTNPKTGEVIPESKRTYAVLTAVIPDSAEPTKHYRHELGCGEVLIPSSDGTYLDDVMATTDKHKKLHASSGFGTFVRSLRTAGAENGVYTAKEDAMVSDNIKNLIGTKFQVGYAEKDGGSAIGKYQALIALLVYNFGKVNVQADMDAVIASVKGVLATAPSTGLKVNELVGKLGNLTGAQFELAKQSFASEDWIKSAVAAGAFKRTPQGLFLL